MIAQGFRALDSMVTVERVLVGVWAGFHRSISKLGPRLRGLTGLKSEAETKSMTLFKTYQITSRNSDLKTLSSH